MTHKHYLAGEQITNYVRAHCTPETAVQLRLREETAAHPQAIMQISQEQGSFLHVLVKALNVRRALEVGVFTGYSSLAVALAVPDATITACDVSEEFTAVARRYWEEAGVSDRIDLRLGPAVETLTGLLRESGESRYDFAFIDADKPSYHDYYELSLQLVRPGGLIVLDNMLYHGEVQDPGFTGENTIRIRALNAKLAVDARVIFCLVPIADGMGLAVKL